MDNRVVAIFVAIIFLVWDKSASSQEKSIGVAYDGMYQPVFILRDETLEKFSCEDIGFTLGSDLLKQKVLLLQAQDDPHGVGCSRAFTTNLLKVDRRDAVVLTDEKILNAGFEYERKLNSSELVSLIGFLNKDKYWASWVKRKSEDTMAIELDMSLIAVTDIDRNNEIEFWFMYDTLYESKGIVVFIREDGSNWRLGASSCWGCD